MSRLHAFLLPLCLLLLSLLPPTHGAPIPAEVTLGVVLPLSGPQAQRGSQIKAVLDLLASDVNNGASVGGLPANPLGCPLKLAYADSAGEPLQGMRALHGLRAAEPNLMGVFGDLYDNTTLPLTLLSSEFGLFTVSPGAAAPSLADKRSFPTFVRSTVPADAMAKLWLQQLQQLGWYRVALITTEEDQSRAFTDLLLRGAAKHLASEEGDAVTISQFDLRSVVLPAEVGELTQSVLDQALEQLHRSDAHIFLVWASLEISEMVMRAAYARGMVGKGSDGIIRQWTGDLCHNRLGTPLKDLPMALYGVVCFVAPRPRVYDDAPVRPQMVEFEQRLQQAAPQLFAPNGHRMRSLDLAAANGFIGFLGAARAVLHDPLSPNTGEAMVRALAVGDDRLQLRQPDGQPLVFETNGDVRLDPEYMYWDHRSARFIHAGHWDAVEGALVPHAANQPIFATGDGSYTKDREHVYVLDDPLPRQWDGKLLVLSYMISVLGAWTALILLEQALSFWSRGLWQQAMAWVALASIALGACSIWSNAVMNLTALTLDVDARLWLQLPPLIGAALYPIAGSLLVFAVCMLSVPGGRKPAPNVNVNDVSDVSGNSSTADSRRSGNSTSASASTQAARAQLRILRNKLTRYWSKLRDFVTDTAEKSGWRLPLAAILLGVLQNTEFLLVDAAWHIKARHVPDDASVAGAYIFCIVVNLLSLAMYFHVTRSAMRYTSPFVLALTSLGAFLLRADSGSYLYQPHVDIGPHVVADYVAADGNLTVQVAGACAGVCVALMIFNVHRLQVSRNALDKVLAAVAGQVRALEAEIEFERDLSQASEEEGNFLRRSMEVINLCRPIWRPYAIALALADPDDAHTAVASAMLEATAADKQLKPGASAAMAERAHKARKTKDSAAGGATSGASLDDSAAGDESQAAKGSKSKKPLAMVDADGDSKSSAADDDKDKDKSGGDKESKPLLGQAESSHNKSTSAAGGTATVNSGTDATPNLPGTPQRQSSTGVSASGSGSGSHAKSASVGGSASNKAAAAAANSDWQRVHAPKQERQLAALLKELADLGNLEQPAPPRVLQDIRLPQLLSHPAVLELVKDVLAKNLSPENIALWLDVQRYRSLETPNIRRAVADEIYSTYIATGSRFEVNLSSFMKDYIQQAVLKGNITDDLFDEVEREIYRLMVTNNVESLTNSHMFKLGAVLLGHPLYRLKNVSVENNSRGEIGGNKWGSIGTGPLGGAREGNWTGGSQGVAHSRGLSGSSQPNSPAAPLTPTRRAGAAAAGSVQSSPSQARAAQTVAPPSGPSTPVSNNFLVRLDGAAAARKQPPGIEMVPQ